MQFAMKSAFPFFFSYTSDRRAEQFLMEFYGKRNEKWKYEKEIIIFVCCYNYFSSFPFNELFDVFSLQRSLSPPPRFNAIHSRSH